MKRYPASTARQRFAELLDEADRNGSVIVERGAAQYVITSKRRVKRTRARASMIEVVDPSVAAGQWQWGWTPAGLTFKRRRSRTP